MSDPIPADTRQVSPRLRTDELLAGLQGRVASVHSSCGRVRKLVGAVVAIGSGLDVGVALTDLAALIPHGGRVTGIGSFRADRLNRLSAPVD